MDVFAVYYEWFEERNWIGATLTLDAAQAMAARWSKGRYELADRLAWVKAGGDPNEWEAPLESDVNPPYLIITQLHVEGT